MNFADQKMVKKLRKEFPVGCRIVLDGMDANGVLAENISDSLSPTYPMISAHL